MSGAGVEPMEPLGGADLQQRVERVTPARIFTGRSGTSYRTATALKLRADHAAARDAVATELDLGSEAVDVLTGGRGATVLHSKASSKAEYLRRPDLGRRLDDASRGLIATGPTNLELQVVLGDGLSARALVEQAPGLLTPLLAGAQQRKWRVGPLLVVEHCRVGILNDIGDLLEARVVVLLIGERPGLATASSLSAYLAFRPRSGDTDESRNLVANIHRRGVSADDAATRILGLADAFVVAGRSGVTIKEPDSAAVAQRQDGGISGGAAEGADGGASGGAGGRVADGRP